MINFLNHNFSPYDVPVPAIDKVQTKHQKSPTKRWLSYAQQSHLPQAGAMLQYCQTYLTRKTHSNKYQNCYHQYDWRKWFLFLSLIHI